MESYPRQAGALMTVVAVEESHVVVADADSIRHRARCIPSRASREVEPLKPGDVCVVDPVDPAEGRTAVERVNTPGQRDGARCELVDDSLASMSGPA
jgi:nucleotide-binding universal stress UspA family protein